MEPSKTVEVEVVVKWEITDQSPSRYLIGSHDPRSLPDVIFFKNGRMARRTREVAYEGNTAVLFCEPSILAYA